MTTTPATVPPVTRTSGASVPALTGLEIRKSLSTRSGRTVAALAVLVGPLGVLLATATGDGTAPAAMGLGIVGMLVALVLLVPRRGRVLAAKLVALGSLGLGLAAVGMAGATAALLIAPDVAWAHAGWAVGGGVLAGAAFAVIGAGIGAAVGNPPAALTGTYLTVLGIFPVLQSVRPDVSEKLDPASAIVSFALGSDRALAVTVVAGWLVLSTVAGTLITRRRAVS
jgi:ABC-2 type transport system permease protein